VPQQVNSPLESIPDQQAVRARLAELARERVLLRGLLKLAQRKEQAMQCEAPLQSEGTRSAS
jgi:hypothetical protein